MKLALLVGKGLLCLYDKQNTTWLLVDTEFLFSAAPRVPLFLFLPHFDFICDLLLNRRTATWNLFVKYIIKLHR